MRYTTDNTGFESFGRVTVPGVAVNASNTISFNNEDPASTCLNA